MRKPSAKKKGQPFLRFPVISHGAEFLVQGFLMRRNILAYKAPPNNEGYDLICLHPNPRTLRPPVRIQVKSRYATDSERAFPLKPESLDAFDFLVVVFLNVGFFKRKQGDGLERDGQTTPEFYVLPAAFVRKHHFPKGSWPKVRLATSTLEKYKNEKGFELVARKLRIDYPSRRSSPN